ncbi:MAG TPA: OmpH family outer membrane protein [Flavobacteriaceae bacterium]|nr:OmpH family outer membrane protein [Flavobacteriaceae bacterium]
MEKTKVLFLMAVVGLMSFVSNAQRGVRIGYIDTEYILQNVPEYQEATSQLDAKVQQWKKEIEQRLGEVETKKKQLNSERVLLTQEMYDERLEDIKFEESEILDYQQKRFGHNGDLMIQKKQLIQPIQDQIFAAVQDMAKNRNYDFVFDKSADVVMLYSAERFDISDQVIRAITRASKRTQAQSKAERKALKEEEVVPEINEELEARQKAAEDKKAEREKAIADRRAMQQARRDSIKAAAEARRQKILDDRAKAKAEREGNVKKTDSTSTSQELKSDEDKTPEEIAEEKKQAKLEDREARKKALEERRQKILAERAKAKEEREEQNKKTDTVPSDNDN